MWNTESYQCSEDAVKTTAREIYVRLYAKALLKKNAPLENSLMVQMAEEALEAAILFEKIWEDAVEEVVENTEIKEQ